ncbi:hypothetical protein GF386_00965 [Candidatus Pacearchaeota archaeon]|nr:hypothetical protein [Candidatus Pacearchaeota archaeon]MBD3282806.1 hypothetical protein [Candidatus Pacearchaeota archaeon]
MDMAPLLKGKGVCSGIVKGRAKIIKDLTKIPEIEEGCILVMPFFTPIISLFLSKAKGIVTDFGGVTSHAAIIAREFSVPCVVGTDKASSKIKDNQIICIDGEKGEVYEIESIEEDKSKQKEEVDEISKLENFLESFINSVLITTKGSYGGKWPMPYFNSLDVGSMISWYWADFYLDTIERLKKQRVSALDISKKIKYPSVFSRSLYSNIELKYQEYPAEKIKEMSSFISKITHPCYKSDPFCKDMTNILWDKEQILKNFQKEKIILLKDIKDKKQVIKYNGYLRAITEMLYFYYDNLGHEIHGPYKLDSGELLLIREWHDLNPNYFNFPRNLSYDFIRVYETYKPQTDIKIDISNRLYMASKIEDCLLGFYFESSGKIFDTDETFTLINQIKKTCEEGVKEITSISQSQMLEKVVYMHFYLLKQLTDILGISCNPTKNCIDRISKGITEKDKHLFRSLIKIKLDVNKIRELFDYRLKLPREFYE